MPQFYAESLHEGVVALRESWRASALGALRRAAITTLVACPLIALLSAPSLLMAPSAQPPPALWLVAASWGILSAFLGFALGLSRLLTRQRWVLDVPGQSLQLERAVPGGQIRQEALELSAVRELTLRPRRWPKASALTITLRRHDEPPLHMTLWSGWVLDDSLARGYDAWRQALLSAQAPVRCELA